MDSYGDAITRPFWEAAARRELIMQKCLACKRFHHYPRNFCVKCGSRELTWEQVNGRGSVYSITTVHVQVHEYLPPPYQLAIVALESGVRMLSKIVGEPCAIGDSVIVDWEERDSGLPPLPVFRHEIATGN